MRKLNFWVPLQEPKWHTPSIHQLTYPPPPPPRDIYEHDGFNLPRNNKDTEKNNYGEELLELCKSYNVHVLNGRLDGDNKGEITCIANDGATPLTMGL